MKSKTKLILQKSDQMFHTYFSDQIKRVGGKCVYRSLCSFFSAKEFGLTYKLRAGSCFWKYDMNSGTEWGYQFYQKEALFAMLNNRLPEMHVWVINEKDQVVDMSCRDFPELLNKTLGHTWDTKLKPPKTYIGRPVGYKGKSRICEYVHDPVAIDMLFNYMKPLKYISIDKDGDITKGDYFTHFRCDTPSKLIK